MKIRTHTHAHTHSPSLSRSYSPPAHTHTHTLSLLLNHSHTQMHSSLSLFLSPCYHALIKQYHWGEKINIFFLNTGRRKAAFSITSKSSTEINQIDELFNQINHRRVICPRSFNVTIQIKMNLLCHRIKPRVSTSCEFIFKNLTDSCIASRALVLPILGDNFRSRTSS